jgi:hypothetical protein
MKMMNSKIFAFLCSSTQTAIQQHPRFAAEFISRADFKWLPRIQIGSTQLYGCKLTSIWILPAKSGKKTNIQVRRRKIFTRLNRQKAGKNTHSAHIKKHGNNIFAKIYFTHLHTKYVQT